MLKYMLSALANRDHFRLLRIEQTNMQSSQHPSTSSNASQNDRESAEALRTVASALLQQACQFLEQVIDRDDGER